MRIICCNWKMHGDIKLIKDYGQLPATAGSQLIVLPPAPYIGAARTLLPDYWSVGAQNCHAEPQGALTGMISAAMLAESGAKYVLIGHSERRSFESEQFLMQSLQMAEANGLQPILCVGETWEERANTQKVLRAQLELLKQSKSECLIVAYEPRWAIGSGKTPELSELEPLFSWIRDIIQEINPRQADKIRLLYGGSLGANNCQEFFSSNQIDGGLIGGASLKIEQLRAILSC